MYYIEYNDNEMFLHPATGSVVAPALGNHVYHCQTIQQGIDHLSAKGYDTSPLEQLQSDLVKSE